MIIISTKFTDTEIGVVSCIDSLLLVFLCSHCKLCCHSDDPCVDFKTSNDLSAYSPHWQLNELRHEKICSLTLQLISYIDSMIPLLPKSGISSI